MRIMVNNQYCHVFPFVAGSIKMFSDGLLDFCGLYGRTVVVDPSAEVTCFANVLLRADFATDEIDAVVCAARSVAKNLVGATRDGAFKTVCVGAVFAQQASGIGTCFKTTIWQRVVYSCPHYHVL